MSESPIPDNEEHLEPTPQSTQELLQMLGTAWEEINQLKEQNKALQEQLKASGAHAAAAALPAEEPASPETEDNGEGVLIVDDSKLLQLRLTHTVESLGYEVVGVCETGEEAVNLTVTRNPRLVILDYMLPGMSGIECLKIIRMRRPKIRVIVCSAGLTSEASRAFIAAGADIMLAKPVQVNSLVAALHKCMY